MKSYRTRTNTAIHTAVDMEYDDLQVKVPAWQPMMKKKLKAPNKTLECINVSLVILVP